MILYQWAIRHNIPMSAIKELEALFGLAPPEVEPAIGLSEAAVQTNLRLEGGRKGVWLFRNNVGATYNEDGDFIRYGLGNESEKVNKVIKSGDLIGVRKLTITQDMVGHTIGQFVSREAKPAAWKYSGTEREQAQLRWIEFIASVGGDACFATGEGTL